MKHISVPTQWAIYQLEDDAFVMLQDGTMTVPPSVVLEVMCLEGTAKMVGVVGTDTSRMDEVTDEEGGSVFDEDLE